MPAARAPARAVPRPPPLPRRLAAGDRARAAGGPPRGDLRGEALILRDQGDLHRAERRWDLAHDRLRLALGVFLREGDGDNVTRTRRRLGQVQFELGDAARAERTLTACLGSAGNPATPRRRSTPWAPCWDAPDARTRPSAG
nr:hypothetical protein GCM10020093_097020 [Planobispora longispora]